jgi:hypothetical protein
MTHGMEGEEYKSSVSIPLAKKQLTSLKLGDKVSVSLTGKVKMLHGDPMNCAELELSKADLVKSGELEEYTEED